MCADDDLDVALGERYYAGSKEAEQRLTAEIIEVIENFIDRRCGWSGGPALRDAHAKDNGCVSAEFLVDADLKDDLQHGVFQRGARYNAYIRFSNADCEPGSDRKPDGRGMAIKLTGVAGEKVLPDSEKNTQDFIMIKSPKFFVDHLPRYRDTLEKFLSARNPIAKLLCVRKLRGWERWLALRSSLLLIPNPLMSQYWSTTPYRLGPELAIKFTVKPQLAPGDVWFRRWRSFFRAGFSLKQQLENHLATRPARFDFYIQRFKDQRTTPIEDSKVEWTAAAAEPEHVAIITIPAGQVASLERDIFCENLSFSPWHCLADHRPLGAVNRVRKAVYLAISERRRELNGAPAIEPTGNETFPNWGERFLGGSAAAERPMFAALALDIQDLQLANRDKRGVGGIARPLYAKTVLGVRNATLRILRGIDPRFEVGYFRGGAEYRDVVVRLSEGEGPCGRGAGSLGFSVRVTDSDADRHDLLLANAPAGAARDALQFVALAKAMAGAKLLIFPRLLVRVGPREALRMQGLHSARTRSAKVNSTALEIYWSGGAVLWGPAGPVRYLLRPQETRGPETARHDPEHLRHELADRLSKGDVSFDFLVQPYVNEALTPIEDGSVAWSETASPPILLATLIIPAQDIDSPQALTSQRLVDQFAFNPWHTTVFRPLGNLNRARKAVYEASSDHRLGLRFRERVPLRNAILGKCLAAAFKILNRYVPWHRLGWRWALLNLAMLREELRANNLIDTRKPEASPQQPMPTSQPRPEIPEAWRTARTYDGTYNDLSDKKMGSLGSPFGRTMAPAYAPKLFHDPDPVAVGRELLARERFLPARSLNMLAASWIQFQVHDWVNHDRYLLGEEGGARDVAVPLPDGTRWRSRVDGGKSAEMRIAGNKALDYTYAGCPVFANQATPWWDGSEIYGDVEVSAQRLRKGASIRLTDGYLPQDVAGNEVTGFNESWWLGLSMMHTLFAREHNVIRDALQREYPGWTDERVYHTARLIVSALIAKIHTVEWTPAILATKTIEVGLRANWYGAPKDWRTRLGVWLFDAHALKGIPGTLPNHHGAPYSLTEEFVAVYRLHPLIPDDYQFFDHRDGRPLRDPCKFADIQGTRTDDELRRLGLANVVYSFGTAHPGAITLHNYPAALRKFQRSGGVPGSDTEIIDLSVVDLMRDRMRGVPRYNDFRTAVHKPRVRDWEEITEDPEDASRLKDLYRTVDRVDTMVGLFAETPPEGFGFSDTAFRVFILMASRRLQSDRFLTVDYRPEVYSPFGLDWIDGNGMTSVILRHCPELAGVLPRTASAFAPFLVIGRA